MLAIHFGPTPILAIQKHSNHLLIGAFNILTREDCRAEEGGNTYLQHLLCNIYFANVYFANVYFANVNVHLQAHNAFWTST